MPYVGIAMPPWAGIELDTEGNRVELSMDDLEWDPDTYQACINDEPITGDVYARTPDGTLIEVVGYADGYLHGWLRKFLPDGTPEEEGRFEHSRPVGIHRRWYSNGQLKEEHIYGETGGLIRHRFWREDGTLKRDSNPSPDE